MKLERKNTKEICAVTALLWLLLLTFSAVAQTPNLEGRWEMYNDKGEKFDKLAKVAGGKDKVRIDNGYGAQSTAVIKGNTLTTSDGLTGTISADGTKINWSNAYVWVRQGADARWNRVEVAPIPDPPPGRKIKVFNNAGFVGRMTATYYDKQGVAKTVRSKALLVLQDETLEIPSETSPKPIEIKFLKGTGVNAQGNDVYAEFSTATIPASFSGELCYRVEGTLVNPVVSNCDNSIGDATGEIRQIRFQNDAGYDAQMTVMYFVNEVVDGNSIPVPRTITSGFINGLGGKFRMLNIPKNTAPNMPIQIILGGNATVKDGIFATTLPANFAASPAPCFKVWGTLFDPKGGTCNQ